MIAEETETVIENNIIVQWIMKSDWLTLIPLRIVTVAIRSVLSSIGVIITKIKTINVMLSPARLPMSASVEQNGYSAMKASQPATIETSARSIAQ